VGVAGQQGGKAAGANVVAHQEFRLQDDPVAGQRGGAQHVAIIGPQRRIHAHQVRHAILFEMPFVACACVGVVQAAMLLQVFRHGRGAVALQVRGRSAHQQLLRGQRPGHQR
jgi:hypothetical protein